MKPTLQPLPPEGAMQATVDAFIAGFPATLLETVTWRDDHNAPVAFPQWTLQEQWELADTTLRLAHTPRPLESLPVEPQLGFVFSNDGNLFTEYLDPATAWTFFLRHVGHTLLAERFRMVAWSLLDLPPELAASMLDSRWFFERGGPNYWFCIVRLHPDPSVTSHGAATLGDPKETFHWLRSTGILADTQRETVVRLLSWCRKNLVHYYGTDTLANLEAHWQCQGWPPVSRIIAGTTHPTGGFAHWTAGCAGTVGFLRAVLRAANIPVMLVNRDDHSLPHFPSIDSYLSHGDDPYSWLAYADPPIPPGELLIDQATFAAWFDDPVAAPRNVGRRVKELSLTYLSTILLKYRCDDLAAGRPVQSSHVYLQSGLADLYSVADLWAMGLWAKLDAKIAALGGCSAIELVRQ